MKNNFKRVVVIPAYNEEHYIKKVVLEAIKIVPIILVVDDGSTDNTPTIARICGAHVLTLDNKCGNSFALKYGIEYAINKNYKQIITLDGDYAHNPKEIIKLIDTQKKVKADLVIGNRFHNGCRDMPSSKLYANQFVIFILNKLLHSDIPDVASGFRLLSSDFAEDLLAKNLSKGFMFVYDQIVHAIKNDFKVAHCPISVNYDASEILTTNREELLSVLNGFQRLGGKADGYKYLIEKIIEEVNRLKSFTLLFNNSTYCIHETNHSYLFQKQSKCFNHHTIGEVFNFDEL